MAYIKTAREIEYLVQGGKIIGEILESLTKMVAPGVSAWDIDMEAERLIKAAGGKPAFKNYRGKKSDPPFPSTICASVNEELVHGIATKEKILKDGDIFSIDIGMQWPAKSKLGKNGDGLFTDTAITVPVGKISQKAKQLLNVTRRSLEKGIACAVRDNTVADIGGAIQDYVEPQGYGIVRDLVGHGVGHEVHEEPRVPNYFDEVLLDWKLQSGVVIAIEPMVTMGDYRVDVADDGWSILTSDRSLCAHFEHTVVISNDGPIVVTRRPGEK